LAWINSLISKNIFLRFGSLTRAPIFVVCYPFGAFQVKRKLFKVTMVEQL